MQTMNHYVRLGVAANASSEVIRKAYYRKAKELHPDHNPSPRATELMQLLTEAYETLIDDERRKAYDQCISKELDTSHPQLNHFDHTEVSKT
ncbi:MAG: J domain-containing protein, partial [Flavobacteriales bacterium]